MSGNSNIALEEETWYCYVFLTREVENGTICIREIEMKTKQVG
jgi:hypothetical protein